jgi:hypothetical protein
VEGGPTGEGSVTVTFDPSGRSSSATLDGPPFEATQVGECIARRFEHLTIPPFSGPSVSVRKRFQL